MSGLRTRLERAHPVLLCAFAGAAAFAAYFSMYAFRKPFTAATFDDVAGWSFAIDYKVALVIAQVAGYALSKVMGVKLIAELGRAGRAKAILGLIGASWLALIAFALLPAPWNVAALFLNGLPLGLIWGLVFSYVEGRRTSEVLGAILCGSFIVSSGMVKTVGGWVMAAGVSPFWMPAATGCLFMPLLAVSVLGLSVLPPPDALDEAARVRRAPMNGTQRRAFLAAYGPGVLALVIAYVFFTAVRDFRDNFAAEIWADLGYRNVASVFTASEAPVAVIALATLAATMVIRDNRRALLALLALVLAGTLLMGGATFAFQAGWLSPIAWMIASGAGLYMAYTPFNAMLFDRLIAASGQIGTAGFLIYLADASGYVGSVALLLAKTFASFQLDWLSFFTTVIYAACAISGVLMALSIGYFWRIFTRRAPGVTLEPVAANP